MTKTAQQRVEPIVDPELAIIDAHHHLFDKPGRRYLLDEIVQDVSAGHDIRATVYIESQAMCRAEGPTSLRPVGETEFANGIAAMSASGAYGPCRINAAIVAHADLALGDSVAEVLEAHLAAGGGRLRGIRQVALWHPDPEPYRYMLNPPPKGLLQSRGFRDGFAHLAAYGLSFEATVFHTQLGEIAQLADAFPDTTIVLNHLGFAMAMGMDRAGRRAVFGDWSNALGDLAQRPNVLAKIGGFGLPFWGFGFDERRSWASSEDLARAWRPYIETAITAFGASRCMMESNFPIDAMTCGYVTVWNALKIATSDHSPEDRQQLFSGTAARLYRIGGEV